MKTKNGVHIWLTAFVFGIMQFKKDDIKDKVLVAATELFSKYGYQKTSMRDIAAKSDVCLGNVYNYFKNKEDIFMMIVSPVLKAFERILDKQLGNTDCYLTPYSELYMKDIISDYISLISGKRKLLDMLLFKAQGTRLENFKAVYTDKSTEVVKRRIEAFKLRNPNMEVDFSDFFIHLHSVWTFSMVEEIIMHRVKSAQIDKIVSECIQFEMEGINNMITNHDSLRIV